MKKRSNLFGELVLILFLTVIGCTGKVERPEHPRFEPPVSYEVASKWADSIVTLLSLEEKISLIGGDRNFYTNGIARLNIPPVMMSDATQGVHLRKGFRRGIKVDEVLPKSTAFPCPILLASTWNKELAGKYAKSIGEECRAGGISILLGPGMNIYRISQYGRNFEYFGEDPYLAARMIENYVVGLESTGTIATLKHFVANNTDYYRRKSNSVVDERALHEIYTVAFKAGIDAGAMAVMTSYNQVNGEWAGQSKYVITDLLRNDLGFKWMVMTDWTSVYNGVKVITSGQDLEMPFRLATGNAKDLVMKNEVKETDIDRMVTDILRTLYAARAFDHVQKDTSFLNYEEHARIALETAREGIVLLRNEKGILPVKENVKTILVTGDYAWMNAQGGGSATVQGYDQVVLADAMNDIIGDRVVFYQNPKDEDISQADMVILNIGTFDSEGRDRSFDLPEDTETNVKHITSLNKNTVVVVSTGSGINMSRWYDKTAAIIYAWYPGQNGAVAIAEIIAGKVNPSGKLPVTIERDFKDSPGAGYIPEGESLYSGRNRSEEQTRKVYDIKYSEGIFVGYRWYENEHIEPLYPFGYGLSYTTFEYSNFRVSKKKFGADEPIEITFSVKNTGKTEGEETAQLYIHDVKSSVPRPYKELKGFEKVRLQPEETKDVHIVLDEHDFSFWDPVSKKWTAEPGEFEIIIGPSSAAESGKLYVTLSD